MARELKVAAAQMGPINEGTSREEVADRYRCLGLQGADVVLIGYNTPVSPLALDQNELVLRAGAYENSIFVIGIAKAGVEDGLELIGGSCIVGPLGQVLGKAATTGDELVAARIDLDWMTPARKRWDFFSRRHPQHYGLITESAVRASVDGGASPQRRAS